MKKHLILAGVLSVAIIQSQPVMAVTKCVALNSSSTTCTSSYLQYEYHTNWAATCTTNGVSTPISGIGICSSTEGAAPFATATELDTSVASDDNKHCWCKMTSPVVSRWVFLGSDTSAGNCARNCAYSCAGNAQHTVPFRSALFGSLSD